MDESHREHSHDIHTTNYCNTQSMDAPIIISVFVLTSVCDCVLLQVCVFYLVLRGLDTVGERTSKSVSHSNLYPKAEYVYHLYVHIKKLELVEIMLTFSN